MLQSAERAIPDIRVGANNAAARQSKTAKCSVSYAVRTAVYTYNTVPVLLDVRS